MRAIVPERTPLSSVPCRLVHHRARVESVGHPNDEADQRSSAMVGRATQSSRGSLVLLALSLLATACGGSQVGASSSRLMPEDDVAVGATPPAENISNPVTQLDRAAVDRTIDAGLGRFLQQVALVRFPQSETEPFEGWQILRFAKPQDWAGVGLLPGDVVTSINSAPLETPTQAFELFVSLKTAEHLDVVYQRGGQSMRLSLPIVGAPAAPLEERPSQSAASTKSRS